MEKENKIKHIIPSGGEISLYGKIVKNGWSFGMGCTCIECNKIAQNLLDRQTKKRINNGKFNLL